MEVELCDELEEIGEYSFADCQSLKCMKAPSSVKRIAHGAFTYCEQLVEVELCEGIEEIGYGAFWGCKSLKHMKVPSTVENIGKFSFWLATIDGGGAL